MTRIHSVSTPHLTGVLPDAQAAWPQIETQLRGKHVAIFLDYDGTLSRIASRPEDALLTPAGKAALEAVSARWPVYVVSGRGREDVRSIIGLDNIVYAGSHGFDISDGNGQLIRQVGGHLQGLMTGLMTSLLAKQASACSPSDIGAARIESKGLSLALHYRTAPESEATLMAWAEQLVEEHASDVRLFHESGDNGKVIEIKGSEDWNKGKAVAWLVQKLCTDQGVANDQVVPFFFGDARTDEDGFEAVRETGYGVRVRDPQVLGEGHPAVVKNDLEPTLATLTLSSPTQVHAFLRKLADI